MLLRVCGHILCVFRYISCAVNKTGSAFSPGQWELALNIIPSILNKHVTNSPAPNILKRRGPKGPVAVRGTVSGELLGANLQFLD